MGKTIRTNARIAADETRLAKITTKFDGYIQKLYVNFTGEPVRKGQPLFTIYSPDLLSAQQEYLLAVRSSTHVPGLLEASRERLRLWDISAADLRALERTGTPKTSLTIHSPASGVVTTKMAVAGARAMAGEPLYEIANLDRVWALADVYESELPFVKVGAPATVTVNGRAFPGRVAFIAPTVDEMTRTVKVRIEIDNRSRRPQARHVRRGDDRASRSATRWSFPNQRCFKAARAISSSSPVRTEVSSRGRSRSVRATRTSWKSAAASAKARRSPRKRTSSSIASRVSSPPSRT